MAQELMMKSGNRGPLAPQRPLFWNGFYEQKGQHGLIVGMCRLFESTGSWLEYAAM